MHKLKTITWNFNGRKETYQISFELVTASLEKKLSSKDLTTFISLLENSQLTPHKALKEVEEFYQKHLDLPEVLNLLSYVYLRVGQITKGETLIQNAYEMFPDYLFAKINFADQCLRKKNIKKFLEIFPDFDLKKLYPEKKVFHYLEFRGFLVVLGFYHLAIREKRQAKECLFLAKELDPDHSSVKLLESKLFPQSFLKKIFKKIGFRKAKSSNQI